MFILHLVLSVPFLTGVAIIGTLILSMFVWIRSIVKGRMSKPTLYFKDSTLALHLLKKCKMLQEPFSPPTLISNRHIQSILPVILPMLLPCTGVEFDREYLQLKDRGVIALDWARVSDCKLRNRSAILLIIPGLTDDSVSLRRLCKTAAGSKFRPVVFNRRGHGGILMTTPKLQSIGDPADLRQVVKYISGKYPKAVITAVAMGTGCGLLISYLGEFGSSSKIYASVCVSPCFDTADRFGDSVRNIYDIGLLFMLKRIIKSHSLALSKVIDVHNALSSWRYDTFDEAVYNKFYLYANREEFWDRNNPFRDIDEIAIPVLFINSADDPFYCTNDIPYDLFKLYPNFFLVSTEKGGHCGFLDGFSANSWADRLSLQYLQAILEFTVKGYGANRRHISRSTI